MPKKKNAPAISPNYLSLPKNTGNMTLNELMNDEHAEVYKKNNKLSIRKKADFGVTTLEIEFYDSGMSTMCKSSVPHRDRKKDYLDDILELKREGLSQKIIAFRLGVSESYVSKLLKDHYQS